MVVEDTRILLIDQRRLPERYEYFDATQLDDMIFAIKDMVVRGAPAIGVAAALGLAFEAERISAEVSSVDAFMPRLLAACSKLQQSRPTAVNLKWSTDVLVARAQEIGSATSAAEVAKELRRVALAMIEQDIATNKAIGDNGAPLLAGAKKVLTHCNTGALATCGWGTALGVIRSAAVAGSKFTVYVDETRPRQQGARLTAWELVREQIDAVLITDNMAGYLMSLGGVDCVIVGADRIARNGDTANKIGTYSLAVLAKAHGVPMYVAAPLSTIDASLASGAGIPVEERAASEVTHVGDVRVAADGVRVWNPSFDVTPGSLVTAIITEVGVLRAPYESSIPTALKA